MPSPPYLAYLRREAKRRRFVLTVRIILLMAVLALWEILARTHIMNPLLTSYPSAVWPTLVDLFQNGDLLSHTWATLRATLVGFTISMLVGVGISAMLWWSTTLYKIIDPFMVIANAMPKIALVPIFYIWLGPEYSIYGMAVAISIFITIMVVYEGFRGIDPNKIKLAITLGATRRQVLTMVVLPGSVSTLLAALKMNIGLALVGVIVGEFQSASQGLGFLIINGSQVFKLNIVMAAIVVLALLSGLMYLVISRVEKATVSKYS
ncbi:ABC transporter permease [Castellaniella sp.]|uniref:ABC transporter permease n=1 Tax=Castellaniella sp. TaxID=1955812 RepID=UPI003C76B783